MWARRGVVGVVAAVAVVAVLAVATPPVAADVIDLQPIPGPGGDELPSVIPTTINDAGYGLGAGAFGGGQGFAFGPDIGTVAGAQLDFGPGMAGWGSFGAVNELGVAAGVAGVEASTDLRPFIADLHGIVATMLDHGGYHRATVTDLNEDQVVVGALGDADTLSAFHAAAWLGVDHHLVLMPDLGHGSMLTDVNPDGLAGGWMLDDQGRPHPVVWDLAHAAAPVDLAPITGFPVMTALPVLVNDLGDVLVALGLGTLNGGASSWGHDVVVAHGTGALVEPFAPSSTVQRTILNDVGQLAWLQATDPDHPESEFHILDLATGEERVVPSDSESLFAFNDLGQIATSRRGPAPTFTWSAAVWDPWRGWYDLGDGGGRGIGVWASSTAGVVGEFFDNRSPWLAHLLLAPIPPGEVAGAPVGSSFTVTWSPPASPGSAPVDTYRVFRDGVHVADVPATASSFSEPVPVAPGGTASYAVVAVNAYGESGPSAAVAVVAPIPATPTTSVPAGSSPVAVVVVATPTMAG